MLKNVVANRSDKAITREAYDTHASAYAAKFAAHTAKDIVKKEITTFANSLAGQCVLDIGAGAGDHAAVMTSLGLTVTCLDASPEMVTLCRAKGLTCEIGDIENLPLGESYDGIWAYASLLHIPKSHWRSIFEQTHRILRPDGKFYLAVKEGEGEGMEQDRNHPDVQRWFSYVTDQEVQNVIQGLFTGPLVHRDVISPHSTFIHYRLKKI